MTKNRFWAPVALAVAIVAVIVGVTVAVRGSGSGTTSTRPALLRLAGDSVQPMAAGAPADAGNGMPVPGGSSYVLDGSLPTKQPPDQPVWRVSPADAAAAARIGRALGLDGTPTRVDGGWVLRGPDNLRLAVRTDGSWSYGLDCYADQPVTDEKLDVMCATAAGGTVANAPDAPSSVSGSAAPGPPADEARGLAAPILQALGLADARLTVTEGTPTTTVQASYDVDGTTTVGLTTTLSFTGDGNPASGDGWLTDVTQGDSYPVITATRAFELLRQQPRPMLEMCMRRTDGKPGCADIPPTVITGAVLGLTMAQDDGRPTLVPAWLFTVKGQDQPLAQVAVAPSYLAPPATPTGPPTVIPPNSGDTKPGVTPGGASPA